MVDRYSERRRANSFKSALKGDHKKTEQDEGDISLVLTSNSSTPIVRTQHLNASSIMQSPFLLSGYTPAGNDAVFQDFSLVESVFCTPSKVHNCLSYLNKEFAVMGLPPVARSHSDSGDVVRLVNNTYRLVQRQHQTYRMKEEQEIRQIQMDGEVNRLHQLQTRMLAQLEEKERKLIQFQLLVSQLEKKNKQLSNVLKTEKEEVQRLQSVMHQRQVQHKHESKKKELEYNRLKDRLHQVLVERTEKPGMVISAVIPPNHKFRNEESVFHAVSANYEETQRKLLTENSDFRCALCSFQNELMELVQMADPSSSLASTATASEDGVNSSTQILELSRTSSTHARDSFQKLPNAVFEMPFELVETDILGSFRQKLSSLKDVIEQLKVQAFAQKMAQNEDKEKSDDANRKQDDEIRSLQEKVEHLGSIVNQQHAFIMSQFEQGTAEVSFLRDTDHLEEERWSEAEQCVAEAKKRLLDVTAKIAEEMTDEHAKNYRLIHEQLVTPLRSDLRGHRHSDLPGQHLLEKLNNSKRKDPFISGIQTPSSNRMGGNDELPGTAELYQKLGLSTFVHQSSPFVGKSPVARKRVDETKENVDPNDRMNDHLSDRGLLGSSSVMGEGADDLCSPIGCPDRVKVQLFSQKPTATGMTLGENHGNTFQREILIENNIHGDNLPIKLVENDLIPNTTIDRDQANLDQNLFMEDYLDENSIKFDDDDFFRNTFLSSKSED